MKKRFGFAVLCAVGLSIGLMASGCKEPPPPPPSCDTWVIKNPMAGTTLKVGQTVNIEWCVPASVDSLGAKRVNVLLAIGKNVYQLNQEPVVYPTRSFSLTIVDSLVGDVCYLRVKDYQQQNLVSEDLQIKIIP